MSESDLNDGMSEAELKAIIARVNRREKLADKEANARLGQQVEAEIKNTTNIIYKPNEYMMDFGAVAVMVNVSNN